MWGPTAARFDPYRSLPLGVPPWGHSFGGGAHACIGAVLDGGMPWIDGVSQRATHLYGMIALVVHAVLQARGRPDPDEPPTLDPSTARVNYARLPLVFA